MPPRQTSLLVGNGAGFLGDQLDAPRRLVEGVRLDYLTLEYLAELTLSILARQREKDPAAGYAADFIEVLAGLAPALAEQPGLKIVTNAGGVNPAACAAAGGGAGEGVRAASLAPRPNESGTTPCGVYAGSSTATGSVRTGRGRFFHGTRFETHAMNPRARGSTGSTP